MRKVRLTSAVKLDSPPVCGDLNEEPILPTSTAAWLVNNKLAVWVGDTEIAPENPGPTRAELEAIEASHGTLKKIGEEKAVTEPSDDKVVTEPVEPPKRPYGNAPKSAWVRYAVAVDPELTEERAEDMTKADLMSKYGERLL